MIEIFKALAEENRLRILALLLETELCVCEIEACLKMTQSNASRHLAVLKTCGILESYKNAQWTYFKVSDSFVQENKELWAYLKRKLQELPSYSSERTAFLELKSQGLCESSCNPH